MKPVIFLPLALMLASCSTTPENARSDFFHKMDQNEDGMISRTETIELIIEDAFELYDTNGDGLVDMTEFGTSGGTAETFNTINKSGTGMVTLEEAKASPKVFNAFVISFDEADTNNDGMVSYEEYLAYIDSVNAVMR